MKKKNTWLIISLLVMVLALSACASSKEESAAETEESGTSEVSKTFTLEELAAYDGQNGNPAYVAVDGVVYDVTDIPAWTGGTHNGAMAGRDLTEAIQKAPHGTSKLDGLTVVGTLIESEADAVEETSEDDQMPATDTAEVTEDEASDVKVFTLEELSTYNGVDGNPAYVAVDGVVYDVTGLPAWTGGTHNGNMAGQDLSEAIKKAPHGTSKLDGLTVVGELVQ